MKKEIIAPLLTNINKLELAAREIVEGYLAGRHRSPRHGFAIEFSQHREYSPGDDLKHLDWKVWGRTEKYHLKQYEQETNLVAWIMLDASGSMKYHSSVLSKYEVASSLALAISLLALKQTDAVGLARIGRTIESWLRPSANKNQFQEFLRVASLPPDDAPSNFGRAVADLSSQLGRRGIVFLFSDLLDEPEELARALQRLKYQKHEVVLFQVLDPFELDFPFRHPTQFRGLEAIPEVITDPTTIRESYLKALQDHLALIDHICLKHETDIVRVRSDDDLVLVLSRYLQKRHG